ncbi:MAG: hypothetical protein V4597_00945 [Pseudomonadota bacterium]
MSKQVACPIWKTDAAILRGSLEGDGARLFSVRTGGEYRISRETYDDMPDLEPTQAALLTTWLVDQRRFGDNAPLVTTEVLEAAAKSRPLRFSEKRERFFRLLLSIDYIAGRKFFLQDTYDGDQADPLHPQRIFAWLGARTSKEAIAILHTIAADGYFTWANSFGELTAKGLAELEALETGGADTRQAFVAMWFDSEMQNAWRLGFAPAIRDAGYDPFRIDTLEHNGKIDDAIVAEIKKSRFLVADFTCGGIEVKGKFQPNPRGGVYYEAGLAHGLGMEVIFTCREDRMPHLHFDTRQFAHIVWKTPNDLRAQLYNRIAATVKEAPGAPGRGKGAVDPSLGPPPKPPVRFI